MGETKNRQKTAKDEMDSKLLMSAPTRKLLEELAIECSKNPSNQNSIFQYAFALSKSQSDKSELRYSISMLDSLIIDKFPYQIDCMYGAATALYLLAEYDEARTRCEAILRTNPESRIAKELHLASIESIEQQQQEQIKTLAIGGVAAAVAVGVLSIAGALLSKR